MTHQDVISAKEDDMKRELIAITGASSRITIGTALRSTDWSRVGGAITDTELDLMCRGYKRGTPRWEPPVTLHPRDYAKHVEELRQELARPSPYEGLVGVPWYEAPAWWIFTMSPYLIDEFDASRVLVLHGPKAKWLDQAAGFKEWGDIMKSGELWSRIGEDWVSQEEV